ncbi:MAG: hypothetical protein AAFW89_12385 [Bacteroidota bacterium]
MKTYITLVLISFMSVYGYAQHETVPGNLTVNGYLYTNSDLNGLAWNTFSNYHISQNDRPGVGIKLEFGEYTNHKWAGIAAFSGSVYSNIVGLEFYTKNHDEDPAVRMRINPDGGVGIGTFLTGSHKLAVGGSIGAREIIVEAGDWSDFVFEQNYTLPTLKEVQQHINEYGHLPGVPNEAEVTRHGINLGNMDSILLQKIEELTLYLIKQNDRIQTLEAKLNASGSE